jgi:hypothetical protein
MKLTVIVSFLIIFASKAHAFLVVRPSARSLVVRRYAENAKDAGTERRTDKPFVDLHKILLEQGRFEGTVTTTLKYLARDVEEIKCDTREMKKDIDEIKIDMASEFGNIKATLKLGIAGLFFLQVLLLLLVGGVEIGDAVRLANPL